MPSNSFALPNQQFQSNYSFTPKPYDPNASSSENASNIMDNYYHTQGGIPLDQNLASASDPRNSNTSVSPFYGSPNYPDFVSPYSDKLSMEDYVTPMADQIHIDTTGLQRYEQEAERTGPSAWSALAQHQNELSATTARNQAGLDKAGQTAQAQSALAMHGGVDSGARERIAQGGANSEMMASQGISNQEAQNNAAISTQDEQNRISMLTNEGSVQNQYLQPQFEKDQMLTSARAADVQGQENAIGQYNQYNLGKYQTQGQEWGALQQSKATENANKGNWVVTESAKHAKLPKDARTMLTAIRFVGAELEPRATVWYFKNGASLVTRMKEARYDWREFGQFVVTLCAMTRAGEPEAAARAYLAKIMDLMIQYWPDCPHREFKRQLEKRARRQRIAQNLPSQRYLTAKVQPQCGGNIPADRFES